MYLQVTQSEAENDENEIFTDPSGSDTSRFDPSFEPLLMKGLKQFEQTEYPDIWEKYKNATASFWTVEEVDLHKDLTTWHKLKEIERHFLKHIVAFAAMDNIINKNLVEKFSQEVQVHEAHCLFGFQIAMANVHCEMFDTLLKTYEPDVTQRNSLVSATTLITIVKRKADWTNKWILNQSSNFGVRTVAFAAIQGIFFSGSIAAIFWLKKHKMQGLNLLNVKIFHDKQIYCDLACLLFKHLIQRPQPVKIVEIIMEAVVIEQEFLSKTYPVGMLGLSCELMSKYIEFIADQLASKLEVDKIYNTENPFSFIPLMNGPEPTKKKNRFSTNHVFRTSFNFPGL